jgi:glycosyltransferase involved in cell wall biosynthesis
VGVGRLARAWPHVRFGRRGGIAQRLRILHVYSGNLWGGIESFLATLARCAELVPEMHSEFALCFDGRLKRELTALGAPVLELGPVRTRAPWSVLRARRALERHLAERHVDVVVCHSAWTQAMFGNVARGFGVPVVFYLHDLARPRHWLERLAARHRPHHAIANSEFTRASLCSLFPEVESSVVHYPIQAGSVTLTPDERRAFRAELGASDRTVLIVQACRLQAWKGHARLLQALSRITPTASWLNLQVGGAQRPDERAYQAKLEQQARALGVASRVRFLGQRDDVPRLLAACDVHCQPNAAPEPFGIVFVEALLAGLPTVTFDLGGPREIITPDVGFLVPDDAALSVTLERLVLEPELRRRLGAAGPARASGLCDPGARLGDLARIFERVRALAPTRGRG